jgi:hypothetical protein
VPQRERKLETTRLQRGTVSVEPNRPSQSLSLVSLSAPGIGRHFQARQEPATTPARDDFSPPKIPRFGTVVYRQNP